MKYMFLLFALFLWAVSKDLKAQLADTLSMKSYYGQEILFGTDSQLYGSWAILKITGGMDGNGYDPDFTRVEFMPYGIFKIFKNDDLVNYGPILIEDHEPNYGTIFNFKTDTNLANIQVDLGGMPSYIYSVSGSSLILYSYARDGYNFHFISCSSLENVVQENPIIDDAVVKTEYYTGNGMHSSVWFTDLLTGFSTDLQGRIYKTTDGGKNWQLKYFGSPLRKVFFINKTTGYAVGDVILKTTNSGEEWQQMEVPGFVELNDVHFLNENKGFAVGLGNVKTEDGGESWQEFEIGFQPMVLDIGFLNDTIGFACGVGGYVAETSDGGSTWVNQKISDYALSSVLFTDPDTGFAALQSGGMFKTTNGGQNWNELPNSPQKVSSLFEIVPGKLVAVGNKTYSPGDCMFWNSFLNMSNDKGIFWTGDNRFQEPMLASRIDTMIAGLTDNYTTRIFFPSPAVADTGTEVVSIQNADRNFQIFPNPASGIIYISNFNPAKKIVCQIISMQGIVVQQGQINDATIRLNSVQKGFYLIRISDADHTIIRTLNICE